MLDYDRFLKPQTAVGAVGGPAVICGFTPLRNMSTLAAQDSRASILQLGLRLGGVRAAWAGATAPVIPSAIQFSVLGPGFQYCYSLTGSAPVSVLATGIVETAVTYGTTTRNAHMALRTHGKQVPLQPKYLPVGPGAGIFLARNLLTNSGIRIFSSPLAELMAVMTGSQHVTEGHRWCGDFFASMMCGAISAPLNQSYQFVVAQPDLRKMRPRDRFGVVRQFLATTYYPGGRLSSALLRDVAIRSLYIGVVFSAYAVLERQALALVGGNAGNELRSLDEDADGIEGSHVVERNSLFPHLQFAAHHGNEPSAAAIEAACA